MDEVEKNKNGISERMLSPKFINIGLKANIANRIHRSLPSILFLNSAYKASKNILKKIKPINLKANKLNPNSLYINAKSIGNPQGYVMGPSG